MYSAIFILVYCIFSFDAALLRNTRPPKSSCRNEFIYDVNGRETLYLDNENKTVDFECKVVSTYYGNLELRLLDLNITDSNLEHVENPPGWDLPIIIEGEPQQRPIIETYGRDTDPSYAIKMAVIALLPTQEFTKIQESIDLQQIKAAEDLIKAGDENIVLKDDVKDIILVMGNTGCGKTTLVQWLAGDRSKLVAKEVIPGLEEFIIEDAQDKISRSTISSKTTFPELVIDAESNNFYYDLPGFSDTRNSTFDIANSYFIKKVLDHANSVKIVLTVSYPSVKEGVDRQDFIQLLRHATQLINDINKFERSIVLVVTKVDNHIIVKNRNSNVFVEDDKIVSGIVRFLMKCKHDLEQRIKNGPSNASLLFYAKAIDLIETLLINNDNKYQRISIFRRPSQAGQLVASDLLENERRHIRRVLHDNIFFTVKDDEDFSRTLSDKTIKEINKLSNAVDISLLNKVCRIADKIHVHVLNLIKEIYFRIDKLNSIQENLNSSNRTEIERLILELKNDSDIIMELDNNIRNIKNVSTLGVVIGDALRGLNLSPALAKNVSVFGHYMDFLNYISESQTSISSIAWASSFHEVIVYLAVEQKRIQNHAISLFDRKHNTIKIKILQVSSQLINFFKEIEYNNNDIVVLGKELTAYYDRFSESLQISDRHTTVENVYIVLDILNSVNINIDDDLLSKVLEEQEYGDFLKDELKRVIDYLEESARWYAFMFRFHNYLSRYDVQQNVNTLKFINNLGSNFILRDSFVEKLLKEHCQDFYNNEYENIKDITLNDPKLEHLQQVVLESIQKPDQFCTGDGKFVVKGHNVKLSDILYIKCPQTIQIIEIFASNNFFIDCDFDKTGESVQLFIIAPTWDVQENSKILLDGSSGPNHYYRKAPNGAKEGLDGDDGKPGLPGTSSGEFFGIVLNFTNDEEFIVSVDGGNGGQGQNGGDGARGSDGTTPRIENPEKYLKDKGWYYNKHKYQSNFLNVNYDPIYGNNCTNGGDSGRGGHGGYGGYPGKINIVSLSTQKISTIRGKIGKMGPHGSSGAPGMAGSNGGYAIIDWAPLRIGKTMTVSYFEMQNCLSGKVKTNEVNERGISMPQKSALLNPLYVINEYKEFLRESFKHSVAASNMKFFLTKLETDVSIQNLYDASGFLDDMLTLESHYYKFNNKTELLYSYQSLLNRINKYITLANHDSNNTQELRILQLLRVAIQSKSYRISNDLENYLVIDVKKYFELLIKQINKYARSLKEVKIDKYRDHYDNNIKSEIKKANNILIQNVMPEIDTQYVNIDQKIKMLVRDIISKKYEAENRKENLLKKQSELAQSMLMKKGLMVLKMFTKVVDIFSFVSELASNALGFGSDSNTIENLSKAQKSIESLSGLFENDQKCLKGNLEEFTNTESPNDDDLFHNIKNKVKPLIKLLNTGYEQYNNYIEEKKRTKNKLKEYHNKLINENDVLDENNNLSDHLNNDEKEKNKVSSRMNEVNRVERNIRISEVCCRNGSVNGDEVSALGGEIENIVNQIDVLNYLEQLIYDSLPPLKAKLEYNLYKIGLSTVNASHAEIDYNNMKIQQIIEDFRSRMNFVTQISNDEIKSKIKSSIDNLQNSVLLVTKINDRINDYYDKMKFASYIANLNSDAETQIIDDQVLNNNLHKLQVTAQSNVILQEYEKASMAFRQYMFPFVGLYLDQILLENNSTNTIEPLVRNAVKTIEFLTDELTKDASVIKKKTYRIYPDIRFDGSVFEQPPFFVFTREHHEKEISNLLNGNEIILTANITNGLKKNAIKFREIGIRIVTTNEDIQSALNHELSQFLIEMTHNGDSYYRCDDKFYIINHNAISMKHSVLKDNDGVNYYHLDHTSTLVRNNPPMCSPYTTWKVRLVNKNDFENFSNLSVYENDIKELALEGWGQYVESGLDVCNDDLKKFYKVYDYFPEPVSADYDNLSANY